MNRRNLLRGAGSLALGLPALSASRLMASTGFETSSSVKDLIVTFDGPFCYWLEENAMKVMAPPVGREYLWAPHQGWIGTNANETVLNSVSVSNPPEYKLTGVPQSAVPIPSGTPIFDYEQGTPLGKEPLFNFITPFPQGMVGGRPNYVDIKESDDPKGPQVLAVGLSFYYKNVDLSAVWVTQNGANWFQPCFTNDQDLPCALLGIHLTPVHQTRDRHHLHAKHVWKRMLSMYPWMQQDISGIEFLGFDPAQCPPQASPAAKAAKSAGADASDGKVGNGPGHICEVPIMTLSALGKSRRGRKYSK